MEVGTADSVAAVRTSQMPPPPWARQPPHSQESTIDPSRCLRDIDWLSLSTEQTVGLRQCARRSYRSSNEDGKFEAEYNYIGFY